MGNPRFTLGQLIHHKLFDYRGVIIDIDRQFTSSDEWYETVAKTRPPKDEPWYRVLVHGSSHETYVAERNLEPDESGRPIDHPLVEHFFDRLENGYYVRSTELN